MIISDYTVIYACPANHRREMYLKAKDVRQATLSAQELIPSSCTLIRIYHDPDFN